MSEFYQNSDMDLRGLEVAILTSTCNKYKPGKQTFYLPTLTPTKEKSRELTPVPSDNQNLENKDSDITTTEAIQGSNILIDLPKEVARWYPKKWIPPGTRFLVKFIGGDITKPQIVGRDF